MSAGIGAFANKVSDDEVIIYKYGGYNLNKAEYRNESYIDDGIITISKICFTNFKTYNLDEMIKLDLIIIKNCSCCWHTTIDEKHIDVMALHILFRIFRKYQEERKIPENISYDI